MTSENIMTPEQREALIHGLRTRGWSRIEAEIEADDREETARARALANQEKQP